MKKQLSYIDSVHRSGTIWNISVMILLLAFPLTVAALFGAAPDWGALVVGLPKNMDGSEGARAAKCRRFAARVANAAGLPVILWDERRTTVSAAAILSGNDVFGKKRKDRLDSVSAAVLLESHLAWRRQHPGENPPDMILPEPPAETAD